MNNFDLNFTELFPGSNNGVSRNRRQAVFWTNDGIIYMICMYASLGLNELTEWSGKHVSDK